MFIILYIKNLKMDAWQLLETVHSFDHSLFIQEVVGMGIRNSQTHFQGTQHQFANEPRLVPMQSSFQTP